MKKPITTYASDVRDIKKSMVYVKGDSGTDIYAVAVSPERSISFKIPANHGIALQPLVHDLTKDAYLTSGISMHHIGSVPVNYTLYIDSFSMEIPLPEQVFRKYLTEHQLVNLNSWLACYPECEIEYLQLKLLAQ